MLKTILKEMWIQSLVYDEMKDQKSTWSCTCNVVQVVKHCFYLYEIFK